MSTSALTLQMPSPPAPVPVVLDPATTALLIFDVIDHICAHRPICKEKMVPAIAALLARARKSGVTVVYGTRAANMSTWLPDVSPAPGDIKIENHAQD
jgi:nicotinamidase-related amidase